LVRLTAALALVTAVKGAVADNIVSYTGTVYTQDFNSLWTNSTTPPKNLEPGLSPVVINQLVNINIPGVYTPVDMTGSSTDIATTIQTISNMTGWYAINNGGNSSPLTYSVDNGNSTSNALFAYYNPIDAINLAGTSNNMALGANAASGTGDVFFGMKLVNNTTENLNAISVSFTSQLFHEDTGLKSLNFGYLLANGSNNQTIPLAGQTPVGLLNSSFTANTFTGTVATANITENLSVVDLPISADWQPGQTLWITWEMGRGGSGQGIGIDNVNFSATNLAPLPTLAWNLPGSGTWDQSSLNWSGSSNTFTNGNFNTSFTDTNFNTVITVDPAGVTVGYSVNVNNNGTGSYTFTGGAISGTLASLNINGGKVVLQSPNNYGLATNINGGTLVVDNNNELGAPTAEISLNGGVLKLANNLSAGTRALIVTSTGGVIDTGGFNGTFGTTTASVPIIQGVLHVTGGGNLNLGLQPTFGSNALPAGSLLIDAGSTVTLVGNSRSSPIDMFNGGVINGVLSLNNKSVGARFNFDSPGIVDGTDHNAAVAFTGTGEIDVVNGSGWTDSGKSGKHAWVFDTKGAVLSNASATFAAEIDVPIVLNPLSVADPVGHPWAPLNVATANFIGATNPNPINAFGTVIGGTKIGSQGHGPTFSNIKITGVISGNSDINIGNDYKSGGSGDLTFLAHNTYKGVTLLNGGGALYTGVPDALPTTTSIVFGAFTGAGASSIDLSGNSQHVQSIEVAIGTNAPQANYIDNSGSTPATLYVTGSITPFYPYNAQLNDGGTTTLGTVGTSTLALFKSGSGTLVLGEYLALNHTTTSTYSGGTTAGGGVLQIAFDGALGASTGSLTLDGGTVAIANPFLQYNGPSGETTSTWTSARPITVTSNGGIISTSTFIAQDSASVNHGLVASVVWTGDGGYNWGGPLQLQGDAGSNVSISGGAGAVAVHNGASISIAANVSLSAGGATSDPFTDSSDSTKHVAVVANGSFNVSTGSVAIAGLTGTGTATVASGASLTSDGVQLSQLTVNGAHTIRLDGSATGASLISSLTLAGTTNAWTGKLDITNNLLVVEATPANKAAQLAQIFNQVANGVPGAVGIVSTTLTTSTAIAVVDNGTLGTFQKLTTFRSQPVDANSIFVVQALKGDTNLDGSVNATDLLNLLKHYNTADTAWNDGNSTYNASVGSADLLNLLKNYNTSTGGFSLAAGGSGAGLAPAGNGGGGNSSPVPEPASLAVLALGGGALLARRRRR